MKTWILKKLFFSKAMRYIRRGYYIEAYYQGQHDLQYDKHLQGLDKK